MAAVGARQGPGPGSPALAKQTTPLRLARRTERNDVGQSLRLRFLASCAGGIPRMVEGAVFVTRDLEHVVAHGLSRLERGKTVHDRPSEESDVRRARRGQRWCRFSAGQAR